MAMYRDLTLLYCDDTQCWFFMTAESISFRYDNSMQDRIEFRHEHRNCYSAPGSIRTPMMNTCFTLSQFLFPCLVHSSHYETLVHWSNYERLVHSSNYETLVHWSNYETLVHWSNYETLVHWSNYETVHWSNYEILVHWSNWNISALI